jgi:hypothetical protein
MEVRKNKGSRSDGGQRNIGSGRDGNSGLKRESLRLGRI